MGCQSARKGLSLRIADSVEQLGFAIIEETLSPSETDCLLAEFANYPFTRSRAGIRHAMSHPSVATIARDPRLLSLASEVLGSQALPYRATLFDKSPSSNWLVVWHQDTALPLKAPKSVGGWGPWSVKEGVNYAHAPATALNEVLALRLHLDDSTSMNGPLRVLPRTHTRGVLTDDEIQSWVTRTEPTDCTVSRGGILAMRPLIIHSSSKARVEMPRRVLHIEYAASSRFGELELALA